MKIKIVFEDKKLGVCEVPITRKELDDIYDIGFQLIPEKGDKIFGEKRTGFWKFQERLGHIIHDILDKGLTYRIEFKKGKMISHPEIHYWQKPKWRKK